MKQKVCALTLLLGLLAALLVGCGAAPTDAMDNGYRGELKEELAMDSSAGMDYVLQEVPAEGLYTESGKLTSTQSTAVKEQKLIKTVNLSTETEDMDRLLAELNTHVEMLGGYVEHREIMNGSNRNSNRSRWASLTLRVPVEKLGDLVACVEDASNVTNYTENVDDVTLQYVDTASRRKALETEYDRLQALLEKADNMSDLLTIESRMTEVRYELESVTSQLRVYDNKVNYATVWLNISEVTKLTPVAERTRWQQIGDGFVESIQNVCEGFLNLCTWILANSPYLLIAGGILAFLIFLARRTNRKKQERRARSPMKAPPEQPQNREPNQE